MRFVFSPIFYVLLAVGFVPLLFAWGKNDFIWYVLGFDVLLLGVAILDYRLSRSSADDLTATREFSERFALKSPVLVDVRIQSSASRFLTIFAKDEYPPELGLKGVREFKMRLGPSEEAVHAYELTPSKRGRYEFGKIAVRIGSRLGLLRLISEIGESEEVRVYPNMRRAREIELKALGSASFVAKQRRSVRRGDGREFESMRDYVRGDELRHISWTATARRAKLTTRQYQIERDQAVVIALDAGRLMTARIDDETKFDTALHASLALMLAAARGGDQCSLVIFGRNVKRYLPPQKGIPQIDIILESLYDLEPELIEPSYSRAFKFVSSNTKKRAFVVILTDLVDKEASSELIRALKLLRPRHLPLVATIGDRDLNETVDAVPKTIDDVFLQSSAEEIIRQRDAALRQVETLGGLALDVTTRTLAPSLLESYLRVKERGLL
ncbi:MAG: DUF58 domain-containing protein [Pyrinomonadaceae bacterium]